MSNATVNLLEPGRWDHSFPWGNITNPGTGREVMLSADLVNRRSDGAVRLSCKKGSFHGWASGPGGQPAAMTAEWAAGALIAKEDARTWFGAYHFDISLPVFRGAWPALWLIDLHPAPPSGDGMGIPPETDILEHFRKDGFLSRFRTTHSFHTGPGYSSKNVISRNYTRLWPVDSNPMTLLFTWSPTGMAWTVNGRKVMTLGPETPGFPMKPMNLVINAGIGPDWKPNPERFDDFIIRQASYHPLQNP